MQDYQAKAIAARNAWTKEREEAIKEIAQRLAEIEIADVEFQVGSRGLTRQSGYVEAKIGTQNALESIKSRVEGAVFRYAREVRQQQSPTRNTHGIEE